MIPGKDTSIDVDLKQIPELEVRTWGCQPRPRKLNCLQGIGPIGGYFVHNNNVKNLQRGAAERVLRDVEHTSSGPRYTGVLKPTEGAVARLLSPFHRRLRCVLPKTAPITPDDFVSRYSGRKQARYAHAVASLTAEPLCARDANISIFVKAEKISGTKKADPAPRVISPRSYRYNVALGVYLKDVEKKVYRAIAKVFGRGEDKEEPVVAKGLTAVGVASLLNKKWSRYKRPVAVGLDAEKFDKHINADLLSFEHSIYVNMFTGRDRKELAKLLGWQGTRRDNKCRGRCPDGIVKYSIKGTRMSGDMNTATGNCLIMCALVWSYMQQFSVVYDFIDNGDDCVLIFESEHYDEVTKGMRDWFMQLGIRLTSEAPVTQFELITFCQANPIWNGKQYVMVRDPLMARAKDTCTLVPWNTESRFRKWCWVVGMAGLALCSGIPVYQEYYNMYVRAGVPSNMAKDPNFDTGLVYAARGLEVDYRPISDEARASFHLVTGIDVPMQLEMERFYSNHRLFWAPPEAQMSVDIPPTLIGFCG